MNDFLTIFKFEFNSVARKKSWIITTIIFSLVLFGATFLIPLIAGDVNEDPSTSIPHYMVVAPEELKESLKATGASFQFYDSEEALKEAMKTEEVKRGFVLFSEDHYKEINEEGDFWAMQDQGFEALIRSITEKAYFDSHGLSYEEYMALRNRPLNVELENLTDSNPFSFIYTYISIFIVYMLVIFYGNIIATSVAREKSDRTMELLITSTTPKKLLFGKVFGAGIAGLLQFVTILVFGLVGLMINLPKVGVNLSHFFNLSTREVVIMLLFILLGYFMYLFIYAMLGSTVSKTEEAAQATMPIMLIFVGAYILVNSTLSMPNSMAMKIASFVPFSAPIGMVARANLASNITVIEIIISALLLILSTIIFAFVGSIIYRLGSLNYGNRLKFGKAIKMIIQDRKN